MSNFGSPFDFQNQFMYPSEQAGTPGRGHQNTPPVQQHEDFTAAMNHLGELVDNGLAQDPNYVSCTEFLNSGLSVEQIQRRLGIDISQVKNLQQKAIDAGDFWPEDLRQKLHGMLSDIDTQVSAMFDPNKIAEEFQRTFNTQYTTAAIRRQVLKGLGERYLAEQADRGVQR